MPRGVAYAQGRGSGAWTTVSGDAQRSAWVRSDPKITPESVQNGAFQFLWKSALDNPPRQLESLTQPLLLPNIISYKGFKALAFVGGSSDNVYAIDSDLNRRFWSRHLETGLAATVGTPACPGALTTITRQTQLVPPNPNAGRGGFLGAGGGTAPARGRGRAAAGARVQNNYLYAVSSGGMLHALNPQTGEDAAPPAKFVAPGTNLVGSILVDDVLYAAATGGCNGTPNGVHAIELENSNAIRTWDAGGANVAGIAGPALSPDGTIYVAAGNTIVALDPATLAQKDAFTAPKPFASSPVVLTFKEREIVAAANEDGRVYVLDAGALGGTDRKTPLAASAATGTGLAPRALATWEDADGTRWIVAPAADRMVAFRLTDEGGPLSLRQAWRSHEMAAPLPPAVVNGVVFAVAGGGVAKPAVLFALDGKTGKELWNSGTTMTSFARRVGPSAGDSQVYVVTFDGTVYAFGIPLEH